MQESTLSIDRLAYRVKGLKMVASVLHIGAHPDDEDIGLLSYLSHKYGVRTVYWSATRGEGGQNRVGAYTGEALGIYRTWETLAARSNDGGEALFGPFFDFGYCKSSIDAFSKWGRETIVREMVRAIRQVKPMIVVGRWLGAPSDLHGHHQAVGEALYDAFDADGKPDKFPELTSVGLHPWQPAKFYLSTDNTGGDYSAGAALNLFGRRNPELEQNGALRINTGEYDPISGMTYQKMAWLGYNNHKTQALGMAPAPGDFYYYFTLHKSHVPVPTRESEFFDGFDPTLAGLAERLPESGAALRDQLRMAVRAVDEAVAALGAADPRAAGISLLQGLTVLREAIRSEHESGTNSMYRQAVLLSLDERCRDFEDVASQCLGLELEGISTKSRITPDTRISVQMRLWNHRGIALDLLNFDLGVPKDWRVEKSSEAATPTELMLDCQVTAERTAAFSVPYWLRSARNRFVYTWPDDATAGRPFNEPELQASCRIAVDGTVLTLRRPVMQRQAFPGGYREFPVAVVPTIALQPQLIQEFRPVSQQSQTIEMLVTTVNNAETPIVGSLRLDGPAGWTIQPKCIAIALAKPGDSVNGRFEVELPAGIQEGTYILRCNCRIDDQEFSYVVTPVRMGALGMPGPPTASNCIKEANIISPAEIKVSVIRTAWASAQNCAYVSGVKEEIRETLRRFDVSFRELSDDDLAYSDLQSYDVIVVGPNAYLLREGLRNNAKRLLDYVHSGGTLIVQYQGYGYQNGQFAPFPFRYNQPHDRITNETSKVTISDPDHLVFSFPNKIAEADFDGWVYDRGMYFFGDWDKRYRSLMECADSGEEPKGGGLLNCQFGRGHFIYVAYSFFRQLPAGVPGAFRLFANLLALPSARLHERAEFLKQLDLFAACEEEQLIAAARLMSEAWYADGTVICQANDVGTELYLIYNGVVDVIKTDGGVKKIVASLERGACVGEMAVIGNVPRTATLVARGDVELLVIRGDQFKDLLKANSLMAISLLETLVKRLTQVKP
jgi:LmbE family N-acetylglucosaminyl deacetylase